MVLEDQGAELSDVVSEFIACLTEAVFPEDDVAN